MHNNHTMEQNTTVDDLEIQFDPENIDSQLDFNQSYYMNITPVDCYGEYLYEKSFRHTLYFQVGVIFMYSAIFCVALLGNGAVCFLVTATPRMRTVTNYFIANLALGDILMTLFCVPFSCVAQFLLDYWPFGIVMCGLVSYSQVVSVFVSAYTLVALAADRYRTIMAPLRPRLTKTMATSVIGTVWVGALATALPTPLVSTLTPHPEWHNTCEKSICHEDWTNHLQGYYYSMALMTLQFVVPLSVLVITYTRIAIAVWGGRPPGEAENSRDKRMAKSKRKMVKMMIVVVVVYTICWLPINVFLLLFNESWSNWSPTLYIFLVCHWLAMSHTCYNPIIYCYMNARFRAGFLQMLGKIPCCRRYAKARLSFTDGGNRSSVAGNIPMTETTDNMLFKMNTDSTYISIRRGPGTLGSRNSVNHKSQNMLPRPRYGDNMLNHRI